MSQMGVVPLQWNHELVHSTQTLDVVSHAGVAPVHGVWFAASHSTQAPRLPPASAHTVVPGMAAHSASAVHAVQVLPAPQMGVMPLQSPFETQATQTFATVSHSGAPPAHADVSPASHCTHAPLLAPASAQTSAPAVVHSVSLAHARQTLPAPQTGVVPEQSPSPRQPTQTLVATSHSGVAPVQAVWSLASHSTHAPSTHRAPVQSAVLRHSTQPPAATSQSGVAPAHAASEPQTQARSTHPSAVTGSHAVPQAVHALVLVSTQLGSPPESQQS